MLNSGAIARKPISSERMTECKDGLNDNQNQRTMELTEEERQQMLKDLERDAADDLWNFLQDAAEGIKNPEGIKTDEQWPVIASE